MKKICIALGIVTLSLSGYSQNNPQVEKQVNDPQRKANAGKADVIIVDKKNIFDSTTFDNDNVGSTNDKTVKAGAKQKKCGSKPRKAGKGNTPKK